jgi:modulator of FtsH protease
MDVFQQTLQSWQSFFTAVATAAATLTGLLFVSLSLNRDRLRGDTAHLTLSIARNTFSDFLYVLMIALVFLVPHQVPLGLTVALLALGLASGLGVILREARQLRRNQRKVRDLRWILRHIGLPAIASLGLIWVAVEIWLSHYIAIYGLVGVIAALLITACWNAWLLLVE